MDAHKTDQYTVGQWAEAWFENYAKPSIRETTAAYYKNYIDKHIVDAKTVSSILGHYSAGFTLDTYTHVTNEMQKDAAQRMGSFMAQAV